MVARYFAYGSNMNPTRVADRGIDFEHACAARLEGFVLAFDKSARDHAGTGHANLRTARSGVVEGVLYWLGSASEIEKMDRFERTPINYSRDIVQVRVRQAELPGWMEDRRTAAVEQVSVSGWTYFANPAVRRPDLVPPRSYLNHLLAGRDFLTPEYLRMLEAWPCDEGR